MEKIQKILSKEKAAYPYTSAMRNFIATSINFTVRQTEWVQSPTKCCCGIQLYERGRVATTKPLFCLEEVGKKLETFERLYKELYDYLAQSSYVVQGEENMEMEHEIASKQENVIITGPTGDITEDKTVEISKNLLAWSNTEKYYNFSEGDSAIMNRWFPMDDIQITTKDYKQNDGGLIKAWKIPEDLIKDKMNNINILPLRGFVMGKLDLEFKMIVQANPFQACCLMLGTVPNPYALDPYFNGVKGVKTDNVDNEYPFSFEKGVCFGYNDFQVAVQRPNVKLDVSAGGEALLRVTQKFHRTLLRTMDYSFVDNVSVGLRGSWSSSLTLHMLSNLVIGSGSDAEFYVRIFYRFVDVKLTAMASVVEQKSGQMQRTKQITAVKYNTLMERKRAYALASKIMPKQEIEKFYTQGLVWSAVKTGVDVAGKAVDIVDSIAEGKRKGFRTSVRDKPRDIVGQIQVVPRARKNFTSGTGLDDAIVMAVGWDEMIEFFESFKEEPTNFKQFADILGYKDSFVWTKANKPGNELYEWNVSPVFVDGNWGLDANRLRSPLMIASSAYTNYWGTMELMFQFVKTNFHRGALEISIQFGRSVKGSSLDSAYVKILTLQEASAFKVTIPYIYDTCVRPIEGTCIPYILPDIARPNNIRYHKGCFLTVRVLNELTCPNTVSSAIEVLVWIKGGKDFGFNSPRPVNTVVFVAEPDSNLLMVPLGVQENMKTSTLDAQLTYELSDASINKLPVGDFVVQMDDFNQGDYIVNRLVVNDHTNFKDILKMPVKVLEMVEVEPDVEVKYSIESIEKSYKRKNYFNFPIAPLSSILVHYLNNQVYKGNEVIRGVNSLRGATLQQQSIQYMIGSMFGMFRGSIIISIVVHSKEVIYVSYLPHDGRLRSMIGSLTTVPVFSDKRHTTKTIIESRASVFGIGSDLVVDPSMTGIYTSMIVPSVNPTERFEIPMTNSVNWLLMNRRPTYESSAIGFQTLRENFDWFNGHLTMWSHSKMKFDVFLSAGDDLELGGFLGHVGVCNPWGSIATIKDNWRVQSDFSLKDVAQTGWKSVLGMCSKFGAGSLCAVSSSMVTPILKPVMLGAFAFFFLGGYNELQIFRQTLDKIDEITQEKLVESVQHEGAKILIGIVQDAFPIAEVRKMDIDKLWSAAQHIIHSVIGGSWKNAAFGFFCMMVKLDIFSFPDWKIFGDCFTKIFSVTGEEFVVQSEAVDAWASCMELITTLFCSKMQVESSGSLKQFLIEMFQWQNYRAVSGINAITVLMRNLIKAIRTIFDYLTEKKDPRIKLMKMMAAQGSDISKFVEEATLYLNVTNNSECKKKDVRIRFLHTVVQAYKLKALLIEVCNPQLTGQLMQLCNEVIKKAVQQRYLFKCDLVKTEPFVLSISGASNLGKSFSTYDIAVACLNESGFNGSMDCVFTIPAGVKYWNGYEDQPVVWYDDWCNLMDDETVREHISQLYALKTSAPFNVPRAEIENKEQTANPQIVVMTTNNPFPKHPSIHHSEAVYRRRDFMVQFELKEEYRDISEVPEEILREYEHLDVRFYANVKDSASLQTEKFSYADFKKILLAKYMNHYKKELKNKESKYKILSKLLNRTSLDELDIGNPFDVLARENDMVESKDMPSILVEREVYRLHKLLTDHMEILKIKVPDSDIFETQNEKEEDNSNYLFECTDFEATDREKEHRKNYDEIMTGWRSKVMDAISFIARKTMICLRCGTEASCKGTTFWCPEHSHYLCFHCGLIDAKKFGIERNNMETYLETCCSIHNTRLVVRHEGLMRDLKATILGLILRKPMYLVTNIVNYCKVDSSCVRGFFVSFLRHINYAIRTLIKVLRFPFYRSQVDIEDNIFSHPVYTLGYAGVEKNTYTQQEKEKFEKAFVKDECASTSAYKIKYICPHSLLSYGFMFRDSYFYPVIGDRNYAIKDGVCLGGCALTNMRFLEYLRDKFYVSAEKLEGFEQMDLTIIEKYFPIFTFNSNILAAVKRRYWVRKIVRADWWENYIFPVADTAWQFVKKLAPIIAMMAVLWGATKGFQAVWAWIKNTLHFDSQSDTRAEGKKFGMRSPRRNKPRFNTSYNAQANDENFQNKLNKIASNYVVLTVAGRKMVAWGLRGTTVLMPRHLAERVKRVKAFSLGFLNAVERNLDILVENCEIFDYSDRDLSALTIGGVPVLFKDCVSFLPGRGNDYVYSEAIILDVNAKEKTVTDLDTVIIGIRYDFTAQDGDVTVDSKRVVMYDKQRSGMCGSIVCVDSVNPILAIHIAGSAAQDRGVGILLYREDFSVQGLKEEIESQEGECRFYGEDCLIEYEAVVDLEKTVHIPSKTKIIRSVIADEFDKPLTFPAYLTGKEEGYLYEMMPLYYGVVKNGMPVKQFRNCDVENAFDLLKMVLINGNFIRTPTVLTTHEAVVGLPEVRVEDPYVMPGEVIYYGCLPLDTSAGYPFTTSWYRNKFKLGSAKKDWIQIHYAADGFPEKINIHPEIVRIHNSRTSKRAKGIITDNIFQDCLKDERRLIEKRAQKGGTRLFSMSNVEGSIALRKYTLDLTAHLRYNRIKNGIAVGINPESMEWTILANTLLKNSNNIFTTDFTNFGAGLNYQCGMKFRNLIYDYYKMAGNELKEIDKRIIDILIKELMGSRHIAGSLIYSTFGGIPSGCCVTVEINSFVHLLYIIIAWIIIMREIRSLSLSSDQIGSYNMEKLRHYLRKNVEDSVLIELSKSMSMQAFRENCVFCVYGDDGIFSISDYYREVFNSITIGLVFESFDISVTDATKSREIRKYTGLEEAVFLKRKFVAHELMPSTLFMAQMDWKTVEECVKWIHKGEMSEKEATYENCLSSLQLSFGWGSGKFGEWKNKINLALIKNKMKTIDLTWEDVCAQQYPELTSGFI